MLDVALVGCGHWGRHILRDLVALGGRVTVVARSEESRGRAREGGAARVVPTVAELPEVAGIVVATPTPSHADVIDALLPRRVPLFVEKPLASDAARARAIAEVAGDRVFVMDKWRYHPGVAELARIARTGELGPLLGVRSKRLQWSNPHPGLDCDWHLLPHDLAIFLEIAGRLPAARSAVYETVGGEVTGVVGLLGDAPWLAVEVSTRYPRHFREVALHARDGVALLGDAYADAIEIRRWPLDGAPPERRPVGRELPLLLELRAFLEHLRGGPPPKSAASEGAAIVATIAALRRVAG